MPLTIGSNLSSLTAQRRLSESSSLLSKTYERLSSGQRINTASDDAAGLSIAEKLRSDARVLNQGLRNLNDGISLINIANSAINELTRITTRITELAEQSANGSYSNSQRSALDREAQSLAAEYFRISRSAKFNNVNLFDGSVQGVTLQAGYGTDGSITSGLGGSLGTGTFATQSSYSTGPAQRQMTSGDFNNDGYLDIVTGDGLTQSISVFLGQGTGSFSSAMSQSVGAAVSTLATGDINNDGVLDLVTGGGSSFSVLLGNGNGTFGNSVSFAVSGSILAVKIADYDGDGVQDIAAGTTTLNIFRGSGNGSFSYANSFSQPGTIFDLAAGDLNNDGILDSVSVNTANDAISVSIGQGGGSFSAYVSYAVGDNPLSVELADFNSDGNLDIVTADRFSASISVLIGQGDGTFAVRVSYANGNGSRSVATADFNGDNVIDIVAADANGYANVFIGRGDGTFNTRVSYVIGSDAYSVTTGDFNEDGVPDFAALNYGSSNMSILLSNIRDGVAPLLPFSLGTIADARQALPVIRKKLDHLIAQQGKIGAFEARVVSAGNAISAARENYLAAESRIRDADIAKDSSELVRLSILQNAASGVLAQANLQPELSLRLLSGTD